MEHALRIERPFERWYRRASQDHLYWAITGDLPEPEQSYYFTVRTTTGYYTVVATMREQAADYAAEKAALAGKPLGTITQITRRGRA